MAAQGHNESTQSTAGVQVREKFSFRHSGSQVFNRTFRTISKVGTRGRRQQYKRQLFALCGRLYEGDKDHNVIV